MYFVLYVVHHSPRVTAAQEVNVGVGGKVNNVKLRPVKTNRALFTRIHCVWAGPFLPGNRSVLEDITE